MNGLRKLLLCTSVCVLSLPLAAFCQPTTKIHRIGFLSAISPTGLSLSRVEAFRQGMKELGYVEGRNIVIEYRWAEGKTERLPQLAADLVRNGVEVIVSAGPSATRPAKQATSTVPIVMAFDSDPVASGFVASYARPGGNVTGLSILAPEVSGKQVEFLKQIVPGLSRLMIFSDSKEPGDERALKETAGAALALGIQVRKLDLRDATSVADMFQAATKEQAGALIVLPSVTYHVERVQIANLATRHRLPAIYPWLEHVEAGGLMTYSVKIDDLYRRAASYVDKILKGAKPAELPVEQPYKFELLINVKAARQIGLTIPVNVLMRADRVIE